MLQQSSFSKPRGKTLHFILLFALLPFTGCTENPFGGNNDISSGARQVRGTLQLSDRASPEGAWVWLENFNLGARADASGRFELNLPPPGTQGRSGATGIFDLYYYLANYKIVTAKVATRNGEFVYDQADINKKGEIGSAPALQKFLSIATALTPATISVRSATSIDVAVTLQAESDTVTVVIPQTIGLGNLIGALLIRSLNRPEILVYVNIPGNERNYEFASINTAKHLRTAVLNLLRQPLAPGDYEVIPYILIRHQNVPRQLMATLGPYVEDLGPNYLQIPMARAGGRLHVDP